MTAMTVLVIVAAVLAAISTTVLAIGLYTIRRAAIAEGIGADIIDPNDNDNVIVNGTVASRWLVVTFVVVVAAGSTILGVWTSRSGSLDDGWNLLIIAGGQAFAWAAALLLRQENIRARSQHRLYKLLYFNQAAQ